MTVLSLLPTLIVVGSIVACSTTQSHGPQSRRPAPEPEVQMYIDRYLADPATPEPFKEGIRRGVVVEGMCPLQAFAAAGTPGPYRVTKDKARWTSDVPPPVVVEAQCDAPDESVIELIFRNSTQFSSDEPRAFRVRFVKGKVVLVDQKGFNEQALDSQ
jgi:hypothetical protein